MPELDDAPALVVKLEAFVVAVLELDLLVLVMVVFEYPVLEADLTLAEVPVAAPVPVTPAAMARELSWGSIVAYAFSADDTHACASAGRDASQAGGEAANEAKRAGRAVWSAKADITEAGTTVASLSGAISSCSRVV